MLKSLRSYCSDIISSCFPESWIWTRKLHLLRGVRKAQQQSESFQVLRVSIKHTDHMDSPNSVFKPFRAAKQN